MPTLEDPGRRILTVSALTALIKESLDARFGGVWVEGEISNLRVHGSGHVYFTLKDEGAQIRAVLFRGRMARRRSIGQCPGFMMGSFCRAAATERSPA